MVLRQYAPLESPRFPPLTASLRSSFLVWRADLAPFEAEDFGSPHAIRSASTSCVPVAAA
eukprot:scaffold286870_cov30-Tisochrysis_lutea.AAC.1